MKVFKVQRVVSYAEVVVMLADSVKEAKDGMIASNGRQNLPENAEEKVTAEETTETPTVAIVDGDAVYLESLQSELIRAVNRLESVQKEIKVQEDKEANQDAALNGRGAGPFYKKLNNLRKEKDRYQEDVLRLEKTMRMVAPFVPAAAAV